jgi:hypothetical protein
VLVTKQKHNLREENLRKIARRMRMCDRVKGNGKDRTVFQFFIKRHLKTKEIAAEIIYLRL